MSHPDAEACRSILGDFAARCTEWDGARFVGFIIDEDGLGHIRGELAAIDMAEVICRMAPMTYEYCRDIETGDTVQVLPFDNAKEYDEELP